TFWLSNGLLLRTQTSTNQIRAMESYGAPIKICAPGRCFRNEDLDASHENTFYQLEGMVIDKDISINNLIYVMKELLKEVFQKDVAVRLRPGFFPFVEPGFELDCSCLICGGAGCPTCKNSGWIELCPCGMIHPKVLKGSGIDPEVYTGFAFGLGLSRLAMMKYKINDIRILNSGDLRYLQEFND
ncbi:MAG: phenylalanine--tRNA ligase subunit alpha, partial [Bacilli bacterium]